jgi:hypothetical protein
MDVCSASDIPAFKQDATILIWILERQDRTVWIGLIWLRIGSSGSSCKHANELSGSMKFWKFLSSCTIDSFSRKAQLRE